MKQPDFPALTRQAADLLSQLIATPSVSRSEDGAASLIQSFLAAHGVETHRHLHNVWCEQPVPQANRPTLLLNAHLDTVKPAASWQRPPFSPTLESGRLYGLGSNDCGGGLVTLLLTFLSLKDGDLPWHLVFLASAEEEVSGKNGIEAALPLLPPVDVALVGEPTGMQPAIAEKGLMVLDCTALGVSGHAARQEGVNAIYEALPAIEWFRTHRFSRKSPLLGEVKMSVTMIEAGSQHNVVPDVCHFVVDVRPNECYTNQEVLDEIRHGVHCQVSPRSTRLSSSSIDAGHPLVRTAVKLGRVPFGSPTLSDQALMPFPSLKMGPGQSSRSHTADEYITLAEIEEALRLYHALLTVQV